MEKLFTTAQAAEYLQLSPRRLIAWRVEGAGPIFVKLGNGIASPVRYKESDLVNFVNGVSSYSKM